MQERTGKPLVAPSLTASLPFLNNPKHLDIQGSENQPPKIGQVFKLQLGVFWGGGVTVALCCLRSIWLGFFLLTVEIRFGLFCLRWKIGLVFVAYGNPPPEVGFGLFCLRFPRPEIGFSLVCLRFPHRK